MANTIKEEELLATHTEAPAVSKEDIELLNSLIFQATDLTARLEAKARQHYNNTYGPTASAIGLIHDLPELKKRLKAALLVADLLG